MDSIILELTEARQIAERQYKKVVEQNRSLQQELFAAKKEIAMYNCIQKFGTKECHCACRCLGNEFCQDAEEKINEQKEINMLMAMQFINIENLTIKAMKRFEYAQPECAELQKIITILHGGSNE